MIYLIRSFGRNKSSLKVGFSDDFERRFLMYSSHNPDIEIVATREGTERDEKLLHIYLHQYGLDKFRNEWYEDNDFTIQLFHKSIRTIESYIWRNRDKIFNMENLRLQYGNKEANYHSLYEYLLSIFGIKKLKNIDKYCGERYKLFDKDIPKEVIYLISEFYKLGTRDKYKYLCSLPESTVLAILPHFPSNFQNYYITLGPNRIRALGYDVSLMRREYEGIIGNQGIDIGKEIIEEFKVGEKIPKNKVKERLKKLYEKVGYKKTPKAVDLEEYFVIKNCKIPKPDGTRDNGYEIISLKKGD